MNGFPPRHSLRADGLPDTPLTIRHLRAVAAGHHGTAPAKGLLVTTLVLVHAVVDNEVYLDPSPEVMFEGSLELLPADVFDAAQKTARDHRDWVRTYAQNPLTNMSNVRKSQPNAFRRQSDRDKELDYLAESLTKKPADQRSDAASGESWQHRRTLR